MDMDDDNFNLQNMANFKCLNQIHVGKQQICQNIYMTMKSKCQTLSEYIKRRQQAQDLKLAKFDTCSSLGADKQITDLISAKKEKVHLLLNEILNQVKKSDQPKDRLSIIETMITNAQKQIEFQFQHLCTEMHQKLRHKERLNDYKEDQRSQSSIDKRLRDKELKEQSANVLRQVRTENHMVNARQERQRAREKNEMVIRKKKQGKEEMDSKQNEVEEGVRLRNPEEDSSEKSLFYTFNGLGNDRKQLIKPSSKMSKTSKVTINSPSI